MKNEGNKRLHTHTMGKQRLSIIGMGCVTARFAIPIPSLLRLVVEREGKLRKDVCSKSTCVFLIPIHSFRTPNPAGSCQCV